MNEFLSLLRDELTCIIAYVVILMIAVPAIADRLSRRRHDGKGDNSNVNEYQ